MPCPLKKMLVNSVLSNRGKKSSPTKDGDEHFLLTEEWTTSMKTREVSNSNNGTCDAGGNNCGGKNGGRAKGNKAGVREEKKSLMVKHLGPHLCFGN
jgi:hypothetical protein